LLPSFFEPPPQHPQFGPWLDFLGLSAERSFVSCAFLVAPVTKDTLGTESMTLGADVPQTGQSQGSANFAIGINSSKTPQSSHRYSYTGMSYSIG